MKKGIIIFVLMLALVGCSKKEATPDTNTDVVAEQTQNTEATQTTKGFSFDANGVTIPMNVEAAPLVEALGKPQDYFEAASCAFQGLDKIYYYSGFELGTYPSGKKDMVSYVNLTDDSVSTDKGIYLESKLEDLVAAYGEDYTQEGTSYVYTLGETKLTFIVEEDSVKAITYAAIVEGLNN